MVQRSNSSKVPTGMAFLEIMLRVIRLTRILSVSSSPLVRNSPPCMIAPPSNFTSSKVMVSSDALLGSITRVNILQTPTLVSIIVSPPRNNYEVVNTTRYGIKSLTDLRIQRSSSSGHFFDKLYRHYHCYHHYQLSSTTVYIDSKLCSTKRHRQWCHIHDKRKRLWRGGYQF